MTKKSKGKNPKEIKAEVKTSEPKGLELHKKFSSEILEKIPLSIEIKEKDFSTINCGEKIICFIRDKNGLSIASRFYNESKATKIQDTKGIPIVVQAITKTYEQKQKGQ
jgi:hypothetical protein